MLKQRPAREAYLRSKLSVLIPSQIRSLRQRRGLKQSELGAEAGMKQARVSALERIGEASFSIETLIRLAAAFRVGLLVRFASHSEILDWENNFSPDEFDATPIDQDERFARAGEEHFAEAALSPGLREALSGEYNRQRGQGSASFVEASFNDPPSIGNSMLGADEFSSHELRQQGSAA
jgi:transcriptional regulator with XRE-family HTH domain